MRPGALHGNLNGWFLIFGGLTIGLALWLAPAVEASSRNDEASAKMDFDSLVHEVEGRYGIHGKPVPMMWLANICARTFTKGGVQGMKVVQFGYAGRIAEAGAAPGEFGELVKTQLGTRWSPMVREHDRGSGDSYVYVQSSGDSNLTRMIVVDFDGAELDLVRLSLNPNQMAKWIKTQNQKTKFTTEPNPSE